MIGSSCYKTKNSRNNGNYKDNDQRYHYDNNYNHCDNDERFEKRLKVRQKMSEQFATEYAIEIGGGHLC